MSDEITWADYYRENEGREPRALLLDVLGSFERPGEAVDLGCGAGIDTLAMLERGWRVFATDAEEEAIQRTRSRIPTELQPRLRTLVTPMEDVELPTADLVWASFSLFFCDPGRFADVWARIGRAVVPGGRFAGQLLGDRDTWAPDEDITAFSEAQARALFDRWTLERFEEEENDGEACDGPKHWHVFHVVASAPSS
jgi:SAM-dependent methyltransferase